MVEETQVRKGHGHAVEVASLDDLLVGHGAAGLGHELHAELLGMVDRVPEGEEGVRGDGHVVQSREELALLLLGQRLRGGIKVLDPHLELSLVHVTLDVAHARVHAVLALDSLPELQGHDLGVEPQAPCSDLPARQLNAIHAALLAGPDADHHAVLGVADRIGLRVLDRDHAQNHVQLGLLAQLLLGRHHLRQEAGVADLVVALLHETEAADHSVFHLRELEVIVCLQHNELASLLGLQDLQGLGLETRRDDAVADLDLQDIGRRHIHLVRDGDEVAEGAHRVGVARAHVRRGHLAEGLALDLVDLDLRLAEGHADGGACRAHVFEGRGRGFAGALGELVDQLPSIHGIQEVDVPWDAGEHLEWQPPAVHGAQAGRQLVRVAAVLEGPLHLEGHGLRGRWFRDLRRHPLAHRGIVGRRQRVGRRRHVLAEGPSGAAAVLPHLLHHLAILARGGADGDGGVVLRRGADHARAADVDVLNAVREVATLGDGLAEGVEVDNHQIDGHDAVLDHFLLVLLDATSGKQAAMHLGVQGLHPAV
mmetsp:Transcript_15992/g.42294  ORF Transcript_15992/g.42294 Transcript_15992/m.42294 type:complete len:537 (+) Transcript_15992:169-1779(+)